MAVRLQRHRTGPRRNGHLLLSVAHRELDIAVGAARSQFDGPDRPLKPAHRRSDLICADSERRNGIKAALIRLNAAYSRCIQVLDVNLAIGKRSPGVVLNRPGNRPEIGLPESWLRYEYRNQH